jgi:hypothetical protein
MVYREEGVPIVGDHLHKGITKHCLIHSHTRHHRAKRLTTAISISYYVTQQWHTFGTNESFASDIVSLIVYYTTVRHGTARQQR